MAKFRVTLTEEERGLLRKMVSSGKGAARKLLHGRILLQADANPEGMQYPDEAIAPNKDAIPPHRKQWGILASFRDDHG